MTVLKSHSTLLTQINLLLTETLNTVSCVRSPYTFDFWNTGVVLHAYFILNSYNLSLSTSLFAIFSNHLSPKILTSKLSLHSLKLLIIVFYRIISRAKSLCFTVDLLLVIESLSNHWVTESLITMNLLRLHLTVLLSRNSIFHFMHKISLNSFF